MKTTTLFKGLIIGICLFSGVAKAQHIDTISFTHRRPANQLSLIFGVYVPQNENFTVNWGDGTVTTHKATVVSGGSSVSHNYSACGNYTVTVIGTPTCPFSRFTCPYSDWKGRESYITSIDIGKWRNLYQLQSHNEQVSRIYVFDNNIPTSITAFGEIGSQNTHLTLTQIDSIKMITQTAPVHNPYVQPQYLSKQIIAIGNIVNLSSEATIKSTATLFQVFRRDSAWVAPISQYPPNLWFLNDYVIPAVIPNDYTVTNGVFTFHKIGEYRIKMTNPKVEVFSMFSPIEVGEVFQDVLVTANSTKLPYIQAQICKGGAYNQNGFYETQAGTYTRAVNCDSVITLKLSVVSFDTLTIYDTICQGQSLLFAGQSCTQAGTYTDTLQNAKGCDSIVTLQLTVNSFDTLTIYDTICQGQSLSFGGQSCTQAGTYTDTLQNAVGCDSIVTLQLTVNSFDTFTIYDTICPNTAYAQHGFTIPASDLPSAGSFKFNDTLQNTVGCDSIVTLQLTVRKLLPLKVVLGNDTAICWLDSLKLDAHHPNANYYKWQDGSTGDTYTVYYDGQYWVIVSNPCSEESDTINVSYLKELDFYIGKDTVFCEGEEFYKELDVTSPFASYLWQDGSTSPVYIIEQAGIYSVTVSNVCMSVSKSIEVTTKDCRECKLWLPNVFTPIGSDGRRYIFRPLTDVCHFEEFKISIYNRWGVEVWSNRCKGENCPEYEDSFWWNGTTQSGKQVPEGVYYWVVSARDSAPNQKLIRQNGSVTVVGK